MFINYVRKNIKRINDGHLVSRKINFFGDTGYIYVCT